MEDSMRKKYVCIYMYVYVYICVCICIYIYICMSGSLCCRAEIGKKL